MAGHKKGEKPFKFKKKALQIQEKNAQQKGGKTSGKPPSNFGEFLNVRQTTQIFRVVFWLKRRKYFKKVKKLWKTPCIYFKGVVKFSQSHIALD